MKRRQSIQAQCDALNAAVARTARAKRAPKKEPRHSVAGHWIDESANGFTVTSQATGEAVGVGATRSEAQGIALDAWRRKS